MVGYSVWGSTQGRAEQGRQGRAGQGREGQVCAETSREKVKLGRGYLHLLST